ncbi:ABC transporter permease, partial [Sulfolobus sp. A20-N-G8]
MIRIILRKELLDIKRDRKLLLGSIILPLILLPLIGVILYASVAASPPVVEIVNYNESNLPFIQNVTNYLKQEGIIVLYNSSNVTPDAILVFPANFSYNVSHINRQGTLQLSIIVSSNQQAINDIYNALSALDNHLILQRVTT